MKFIKKLFLLCATLIFSVTLCFAIACEKDSADDSSSSPSSDSSSSSSSSSDEEETVNYVYRVSVKTVGGFGMKDVVVSLRNGENLIAEKTTTSSGTVTFREEDIAETGEYEVCLSQIPAGYAFAEEGAVYKTSATAGTKTDIPLTPTGVIQEEVPASKSYRLGDVMYDFTVTASDDSAFTLSKVLKKKKAVLLNFWATWCTPCKMEFPALNNAYYDYRDEISVLAMSTTDSVNAIAEFKKTSGLHFDMAEKGANLTNLFDTSAIPTSVLIDRYGAIVFYETGSMTSKSDFTRLFDKVLGDDYVSTVISSDNSSEDSGESGDENNMVRPDIDPPKTGAIESAIGANGKFTAEWDEKDEYAWPWLISEKTATEDAYIYSSNTLAYSYSTLKLQFETTGPTAITFDYFVSTEQNADICYVLVDGVIIHQLSGIETDWNTCYAYVFDEDWQYGNHELVLIYMKDNAQNAGDDVVKLKNFKFVDVDEITNNPQVNANIFKYAAKQRNEDPNATTQYKEYITPVYNETDGYYHVKTADGPILFANMMFPSLWNETSVWILAYEGYCVDDGINLLKPIQHHSMIANNNMVNNGYTPVTRDLRRLLERIVANVEIGRIWKGETHENEWLELCVYYQHYGDTPQMEDPTKTLSFHAAQPLKVGSNTVNVPFPMKPRGFKYSFTPEKSGAYYVYSVGDVDTVCFLVDSDQTTFLGEYDEQVGLWVDSEDEQGNPVKVTDTNFRFYYYFEAGKTYYMLMTTYLDVTATYEVKIEYKGESFRYLGTAATGPYSANMTTYELYIPDAIDYYYSNPAEDGDGFYHESNSGEIIYLDCNRATAFFPSISLYDVCRQAMNYDPESRAFYINGKDYTLDVMKLCSESMEKTGELEGFIAVNQEIFELLNTITKSEKYGGIEKSWLMLCYYYIQLGPTV